MKHSVQAVEEQYASSKALQRVHLHRVFPRPLHCAITPLHRLLGLAVARHILPIKPWHVINVVHMHTYEHRMNQYPLVYSLLHACTN